VGVSTNTQELEEIRRVFFFWAFGGVRTDAGVHVGSTTAQLHHAYGGKLERVEPYEIPISRAYPVFKVLYNGTSSPKLALIFALNGEHVIAIGESENYPISRASDTLSSIWEGDC
jgi:hypothetical protein